MLFSNRRKIRKEDNRHHMMFGKRKQHEELDNLTQLRRKEEEKLAFSNFIKDLKRKFTDFNYHDNNDLKSLHRYKCFNQTKIIRNIIIDHFGDEKISNETLLIEFRPMPNLEFLIRNTIIKLPNWNHSVVCGINNYDFIKEICDDICVNTSSKINILKLDIKNLTPSEYSELLTTTDFWDKIKGEKILLYQEDTMLFRNNIDEFLKYDYIGAPWPIKQDDNSHGVGNGGFSLRSRKKMIECIKTVNVSDLVLGESTKRYMALTNSNFVPEDVYFSKSLLDFNIGNVATRDVATNFSQESQYSLSPLGGHNFWIAENKISMRYIKTLTLQTNYSQGFHHRYGWKSVIDSLKLNNVIVNDYSISDFDLIDCMEEYFIWNKRNKNPSRPWYGVIHYCDKLPKFYRTYETLDGIFRNLYPSLINCKGIITLSSESKNHVEERLKKINSSVSVYSLKHPITKIHNQFDLHNFMNKDNYKIIQLGKQYRRVSDIYIINSSYEKMWLSGAKDKLVNINLLQRECEFLKIHPVNNVNCYYTKTLEEYDELLLNNILIIPLWNASANNSILECMQSNIPAFVTRLHSVEEYLGPDYPMFYNNIQDIEPIINDKSMLYNKYKETYNYLIKLDKTTISHGHFNSELLKIINDVN